MVDPDYTVHLYRLRDLRRPRGRALVRHTCGNSLHRKQYPTINHHLLQKHLHNNEHLPYTVRHADPSASRSSQEVYPPAPRAIPQGFVSRSPPGDKQTNTDMNPKANKVGSQ